MAQFDTFCKMASDFATVADFVTVYCEEAHPTSGWVIPTNQYNIKVHKTLEERLTAATLLKESRASIPCPIVVDTMSNYASIAYGSFPERLYILKDNHVMFQGGSGPYGYHIHEVKEWLYLHATNTVLNEK